MSVTPIDSSASTAPSAEAKFNSAVDKSKEQLSDENLNSMIEQGVVLGGQFIIMPKVQEILNEAMASDDDE